MIPSAAVIDLYLPSCPLIILRITPVKIEFIVTRIESDTIMESSDMSTKGCLPKKKSIWREIVPASLYPPPPSKSREQNSRELFLVSDPPPPP